MKQAADRAGGQVVTAVRRLCEGGCGRWLTTPASVALGYGRVCAKKQPHPPPDARTAPPGPRIPPGLSQRLTATNTHPQHPGQLALPLEPR